MLVTGWVSSRIGGKWTLVAGLVLIVAFSAAAGASHSIAEIIDFRAGWGLGNALFIATSLAVIIGAASGGFSGAIILYETALGVGIALGPLVGGELGGVSWRGPFFGVAVLMTISLVATLLFVDNTPRPVRKTSILEPLKALRHRGLATMSITALGYNWGFFTLLAYTPFPMHLGIHQLGYVFTGWGVLVAIFAVFAAPRLQARFGTPRVLYVNLALLAADLVVIAAFTSSKTTLIVAVIISGAFVGLNNTLTTQAVMLVAPVERPVASASYGFVRFIGGGLAPYVASKLAADFNVHVPFYLGAGTVVAAIAVLATGHSLLTRAEQQAEKEELMAPIHARQESDGVAQSGAPSPAPDHHRGHPPILAAVDAGSQVGVTDAAIRLAQLFDCPVEILHVVETDVIEELAVDIETLDAARDIIDDNVNRLRSAGIAGDAHLVRVIGGHGEIGRRIAEFATECHARMIVVGPPTDGEIAAAFSAGVTDQLIRYAPCPVHIVPLGSDHEPNSAGQIVG
jgi:MFS family permease/nucleotide-binding universal stress UspA family protein